MASNVRWYLWSKKDGHFGKESQAPDATSGYSDCRGMWKDGPMFKDPSQLVVGQSTPAEHAQFPGTILKPPSKRFQSNLNPSTPRSLQTTLATIPTSLTPASPSSCHNRPAISLAARPSPIKQSRASPIVRSHQLQHEASSSKRREEVSSLPFVSTQLFQQDDCWPI
ncbi:hypothetical protein O181_073833 [Austropuccinia psidii MF-1]|uniref:Uncharacterized protein n=1 Tax=Austropuccinia psidii MF-1 TaxID=1389203 RepID=A0A9Q3F9W3_9BASI|nr:hypothetical protein [Austropuccinia psidii MF-1]